MKDRRDNRESRQSRVDVEVWWEMEAWSIIRGCWDGGPKGLGDVSFGAMEGALRGILGARYQTTSPHSVIDEADHRRRGRYCRINTWMSRILEKTIIES